MNRGTSTKRSPRIGKTRGRGRERFRTIDRSLGIAIEGEDHAAVADVVEVLGRAGDADREEDARVHRDAGLTDLAGIGQEAEILGHLARGADHHAPHAEPLEGGLRGDR